MIKDRKLGLVLLTVGWGIMLVLLVPAIIEGWSEIVIAFNQALVILCSPISIAIYLALVTYIGTNLWATSEHSNIGKLMFFGGIGVFILTFRDYLYAELIKIFSPATIPILIEAATGMIILVAFGCIIIGFMMAAYPRDK